MLSNTDINNKFKKAGSMLGAGVGGKQIYVLILSGHLLAVRPWLNHFLLGETSFIRDLGCVRYRGDPAVNKVGNIPPHLKGLSVQKAEKKSE